MLSGSKRRAKKSCAADLKACNRLYTQVHGHECGCVTGYARILGFFGQAVGASNAELFRWCLAQGLRIVQAMTLMRVGLYDDPAGAFLCSVTY
jgi:hypothetical protein